MTHKKALDAARTLKEYCKSFDICCKECVFRDDRKYYINGCLLREGVAPEYYEMSESEENVDE